MKTLPFLTKVASGALSAAMILTVGCGQAPDTGESSENSANAEALQKENASLKKQLADTRSRIDSLRAQLNGASAPVVDGGLSAEEIIDELMNVKLTSKNRRAAERRVQFLFESLIQQGDAAVPHIRAFLNKMEDVEFTVQRSEEEEEGRGRGRGQGNDWMERFRGRTRGTSLDFEQPPSLRIGLIDILKEIGGSSAEAVLGEVLSKTARGFEVAYVAKTVRSLIGPDAFRVEALAAAHELLSDPVEVLNPNNFDRNSQRYLFSVLEMYNDQTFIQSAQGLLVREDGKINGTVLDYLDDVGKEQAMDAIYQAFNGGQVTDRGDLSRLARAGLKYTGSNPQANQMFKDIMSSDDYDIQVKWSALREMDDAEDDATLQARLALMQGVQASGDNTTDRVVQMYTRQLEAKVNGEEYDMRDEMRNVARELFSREGGRGGRERGERNRGGDRGNQPTVVPAP
ncbi:MAG: hypothetical protein MK293_07830 [Pedosphaera sp.]|jgi:FtsZ-binding cell division protein ZapB|nr:hypothetical protein [Pedosphaera sp.]